MNNVLVIDTSTSSVAIACSTSEGKIAVDVLDQQSRHSENILLAIDKCVKEVGITPRDLNGIGIGVGPGLFTGLRVGITAGHTLAHATNSKVVPFSSLELAALSPGVRPPETDKSDMSALGGQTSWKKTVLVAKDARRNELYCAVYELTDTVEKTVVDEISLVTKSNRLVDESLVSPADFVQMANSFDGNIILDNLETYKEFEGLDPEVKQSISSMDLKPESMIDLVSVALENNLTIDTFVPRALYLRKSDAELSWGVKQ